MKALKILLSTLLLLCVESGWAQQQISLAGQWHFAMDENDRGVAEKWFVTTPDQTITLPGSMSSNFHGDDVSLSTPWTGQIVDSSWFKDDRYAPYRRADNMKIPAWLQPVKYYKGAAWYIKEIDIVSQMANQPLEVFFERVHWQSSLWVDGSPMGEQNSLATPHRYQLPPLKAGRHTIAVRIDNRIQDINVGQNAHSVSDHTQGNWNGMVGQMYLRTMPTVSVKNMALYPDLDKAQVRVELWIENLGKSARSVALHLAAQSKFTPSQHTPSPLHSTIKVQTGLSKLELTYPMGRDFYLWDEFSPYHYSMQATIDGQESMSSDFGMRKFESRGKRFFINDRPLFLRGTLECAVFPKTGYPAMTEDQWARIFNICKAHGLNHVRFHSWCPPRAAFNAADRLGIYLQVEAGGWCTVGSGNGFDRWVYEESDRILAEYGNHPSLVLYTYGNEPDGANQARFLGDLVEYLKQKDSRHLYTSAAGWPSIKENQYRNDMYPRLKIWGEASPLNASRPRYDYQFDELVATCDVPWVSHEIGQWCAYPDFREIDLYSNAVLQAKNFEIFRSTLAQRGLSDYALDFLMASGKLQTLLYKTEIEAALRTKDFAGFQLLGLSDFPGQGTALVGVLNSFWQSKGYVSASDYYRFSSSVVPLIRTDRFVWGNDQTMEVPVEIANFGARKIIAATPWWRLEGESGGVVAFGNLPTQDIELGNCISLGKISQPLSMITRAEKLTLIVDVAGVSNSWDFWIYPSDNHAQVGDVKIVEKLDQWTLSYLEKGGKVLLSPKHSGVKDEFGGNIKSGFTTIFWNSAWTLRNQPPLTLGLLIDAQHPALLDFPTQEHSNFQWYEFVTRANVVNLTALDTDLRPIVRVIDDWFENRSLALIFEIRVGKGKLLYCGSDLTKSEYREVKQMKKSLLDYMNSDQFEPRDEMSAAKIKSILK